MEDSIRIYVADLAAYNNGRLHGVWIDAADDRDDIWRQIRVMLKASPEAFAEEFAIHDHEGFGCYAVTEYHGIDELQAVARFIAENPSLHRELLGHFSELDEARAAASENYCGCYSSLAEFAQELTEQSIEIPASIQYYVDYEAMGRDMDLSGDVFTIDTAYDEVHVFWNR